MNILKHIYQLTRDIGPRGTGSSGEERARSYVIERLKSYGIVCKELPFKASATFSWVYIIFYSLYLLVNASFLLTLNNLWFGLSLLLLILYYLELYTYWGFYSLINPDKTWTANLVGELAPIGSVDYKVLLVAHLDSSKAASYFSPFMVKGFRNTFLIQQAILFFNPFLIFLYTLTKFFPLVIIIIVGFIYIFITALLLVFREFFHKFTEGASDNASGVAVLLELAESFTNNKLIKTSVTFLFTGAEESGTYGSLMFSKSTKKDFRDAYIINVDNVGSGKLHYTTSEGVLNTILVNPILLRLVDEIRSNNPKLNITPISYRTLSTDALPFLVRGYKAMTVIATDERGIIPHWHWYTDIYDNLNPTTLNEAFNFVNCLVRHIDKQD